ncbi:MAG: CcdB family protein [Gammaproteobacteria bacterium]|nr:CcdB family protein [Gammaproteobacteria bacterium]
MTLFEVYKNPSPASGKHYPYLVEIQSPHIEDLATRIVIPLGRASLFNDMTMKRLTPVISIQDEKFVLLTPQISSVSKKRLQGPIGSVSHSQEQLMDAVDFAIFGI